MRRGLKWSKIILNVQNTTGFKPIPDEEGTEICGTPSPRGVSCWCFKPIPDEEGTEIFVVHVTSRAKARLQTDPR